MPDARWCFDNLLIRLHRNAHAFTRMINADVILFCYILLKYRWEATRCAVEQYRLKFTHYYRLNQSKIENALFVISRAKTPIIESTFSTPDTFPFFSLKKRVQNVIDCALKLSKMDFFYLANLKLGELRKNLFNETRREFSELFS